MPSSVTRRSWSTIGGRAGRIRVSGGRTPLGPEQPRNFNPKRISSRLVHGILDPSLSLEDDLEILRPLGTPAPPVCGPAEHRDQHENRGDPDELGVGERRNHGPVLSLRSWSITSLSATPAIPIRMPRPGAAGCAV